MGHILPAAQPILNLQTDRRRISADANKLSSNDRAAHDWYRFVLSYPPHLVRDYLKCLPSPTGQQVLDPFCGTGTTIVECKKLGIASVGVEAHPLAHFASSTKIDWSPDPDKLETIAAAVAERAIDTLEQNGIIDDPQPNLIRETPRMAALQTLPSDSFKLLLTNSISALPLHKTLVLLDAIEGAPCYQKHMRLALARSIDS